VYRAKIEAARLAERLGDAARGVDLLRAAEALRQRFEAAFWCEDLASYALALDGRKKPCKVRTSNAGHALFGEIAAPARAQRVARALMSHEGFSGWGIRTVATSEARYNPMSYHNGSIWPHDNALIAMGFSRYPSLPKTLVEKLLTSLLDATGFSDVHGLPELFCGFRRLPDESPIRYPVACSPQAWSAGAAFMLLQAALGLSIDASRRQLRFTRPRLPEEVEELSIRDLRIGDGSIDLDLHRYPRNVGVDVVGRRGDIEVSVVK
jgi:glycogen debranching enzyme